MHVSHSVGNLHILQTKYFLSIFNSAARALSTIVKVVKQFFFIGKPMMELFLKKKVKRSHKTRQPNKPEHPRQVK